MNAVLNPAATPARDQHLEQLIREHNATLVNYIYGRVRSRADAYDIAQEAYLRLCKIDLPAAVTNPRALLFKIAQNLAIDWHRQRHVREAYVEEEPLRSDSGFPSPERIWLAAEKLEAVQRAIEALPPRTQMALRLMREEGVSYEELAQRLGIKTHSARRLIERAMESLAGAVS